MSRYTPASSPQYPEDLLPPEPIYNYFEHSLFAELKATYAILQHSAQVLMKQHAHLPYGHPNRTITVEFCDTANKLIWALGVVLRHNTANLAEAQSLVADEIVDLRYDRFELMTRLLVEEAKAMGWQRDLKELLEQAQ